MLRAAEGDDPVRGTEARMADEGRWREKSMVAVDRSLRAMVEHWLAPDPAGPVRVTRFSHRRPERERYVCIETVRIKTGEPVAMFFFRHRDGSWRVFPPSRQWLAMGVDRQAGD